MGVNVIKSATLDFFIKSDELACNILDRMFRNGFDGNLDVYYNSTVMSDGNPISVLRHVTEVKKDPIWKYAFVTELISQSTGEVFGIEDVSPFSCHGLYEIFLSIYQKYTEMDC